jgi:hypothetical protein
VVRNLSRWTLNQQEELPDTSPDAVSRSTSTLSASDGKDSKDSKDSRDSKDSAAESNNSSYKLRRLWEPHVQDICKLITAADNPAVMVEAIGILANMSPKDLPRNMSYADLIIEHDLVEFMHKHLLPGFSEDDVLLEIVVLVGQLSLSDSAGRLLANSPLVKLIYDLLHEKRDDHEITLQVLFTFHRLLRHPDTGHSLLYETQMPRDVCELLASPNPVVRAMSDALLDLIIDHDEANETAININRRLARKATRQLEGKQDKQQDNIKANTKARRGQGQGQGQGQRLGNESENTNTPADDNDDDLPALNPAGYTELRGALSRMVRAKRFQIHNKEWIEAIAQDDEDDTHEPQHAHSASTKTYAPTNNYIKARADKSIAHIDEIDQDDNLDDEQHDDDDDDEDDDDDDDDDDDQLSD